jgi:hypothetical protein
MQTECIAGQLDFEGFDGRRVVTGFDGGAVTSDAGAVLLREADRADRTGSGVLYRPSRRRPVDPRAADADRPAHRRHCAGYEDVNDRDTLRRDPVLALFSDRLEPKRKDCAPLAGKSTVNRLEHAPREAASPPPTPLPQNRLVPPHSARKTSSTRQPVRNAG